ncbi:ABC transporter permease [Kutzneria buriramensis]|uniref:Ribose transport system permease protein n=1 Tax=Kutzneria buriramensis TaxID=1045776 RepID=A0A3E0HBW4_9PSEU|nr:ABC transporter permease [Kutzneria buriramensis]REH41060.1 ribose transport system permease protein [Kutzneria buriramensis]
MTATTDSAPPQAEKRPLARRLAGANTLWIALVLLALIVVFAIIDPSGILNVTNLQYLLIETSVLLVLSVGMTFVIVTSGIDLSVGTVLVFSGVASALTMNALSGGDSTNAGWGVIAVGGVVAVGSGALWGVVNGLLIAKARIPALIVTLGSFGAALGAAELLTGGSDVRSVPTALGKALGSGTSFGGIPNMVLLAAVVAAIGAWLLATTRFGRYTYAIGSNEVAAQRTGVGVTRHLVLVYALSGLLSGLAGFMSLAYFTTTTLTSHSTDNLNAIAGTVLGGTSLFGGVGSVIGTVIGVFIPAVLNKGFVIIGVSPFWQPIAVAIVLVAAVWFDQARRRARNQR